MNAIYILVILIGVSADLYLKHYMKRNIERLVFTKRLPSFVELKLVYNKGAFLGIFKKRQKLLKLLQLIAIICLLSMFFIVTSSIDKLLLSVLLAGALGNIIDKYKHGYVTDYFRIRLNNLPYANLADLFIFVSCIFLFFRAL